MNRGPQDLRFQDSDPRDSPRLSESYPIYQFYFNSNDPWFPPGVIQPTETINSSSRPSAYNSGARSFPGYRSTNLPSECDTAPEDSGYGGTGTRSTYSFAESATEIAENGRRAETDFLAAGTTEQLIGDLNINATLPVYPASQISHHHQPTPVEIKCDDCGASCKTRSELKKHRARHLKPFRCNHESCPRSREGFSTPNDLARHRKTVHREHDESDPIYVCRHDPCSRKKEKLWPRADNFRSHLARSHNITLKADGDLRAYRYSRMDAAKPTGFRDGRRSAATTNAGRRPMQLQLQRTPPVYRCRHNPCSGKTWPRADDLRAHLSAAHNLQPDDDLKDYHFQLEVDEAHALRGVGSSIADVDPEPRPAQLQDSPDLRGDQGSRTGAGQVQDESSKQNDLKISPAHGSEPLATATIVDLTSPDDVSVGEPETSLARDEVMLEPFDQDGDDAMQGDEEDVLNHQEPSMLQIVSPAAPISQPKADIPQEGISASEALNTTTEEPNNTLESSVVAPAAAPAFDSCKASELIPLLKNALPGDLLSILRNIPKDLLEEALKPEDQAGSVNDHSSDQGEHQKAETCGECKKVFSRPCELRKHMKRHAKPYGCTYKTCGKMFGSKNDWKRHESSQHFQLESWNCNISGCGKVLPRRELFKMHLIQHHKLQNSQEIETLQETCRLGRHCDPRFWCGFCDKFVEIQGEVVNSWTKRCDHIDNHLFGKDDLEKKTMDKWHYLEDKLAEVEPEDKLAEASSKAARKRKATEDVSPRPSKRTNTNINWSCCRCNHLESYRTSSSCQESNCQHQRCPDCRIEATEVPYDEDTIMVN
ncbi:hypothetical protein V8C35DRAFT_212381 [Trichoderma chlorosporum]